MSSTWLASSLEESRDRGFLGPGPIEPQVRHAEGFALVWEGGHSGAPQRLLDLGSGGGLPGLVLAERWQGPTVLLDSVARRTSFLTEVLSRPGAPSGVEVVTARAEAAARDPRLEGRFDLVVARSFGPPAATAECGTRFLALGGWLVVAEPPDAEQRQRWPREPLEQLGLRAERLERHGATFQVLEKVGETPEGFPRGVGRPAKRPLF